MDYFQKLFPAVADNRFPGHTGSRWLFYVITLATLIRSCIHIFLPDGGSAGIAGIPLAMYSTYAAQTIVLLFALWGLSQLLLGLVYVVICLRYQSLIPLMYVLLMAEYGMRIVLGHFKHIFTVHVPPAAYGDYLMIPLAFLGLLGSLTKNAAFPGNGGAGT